MRPLAIVASGGLTRVYRGSPRTADRNRPARRIQPGETPSASRRMTTSVRSSDGSAPARNAVTSAMTASTISAADRPARDVSNAA